MRNKLVFIVALMATALLHAQTSVVSFADTYMGTWLDGSACAVKQPIVGYQPTTPGSYPLFVYLVGSLEPYNDATADAVLRAAAARGWVAISAKYNNGLNHDCTTLNNKAACLFNGTAQSAISKGCARADCSQGVLLGGMSQGSQIALIAANYDARAGRGVWAQGVSMSSGVPLDSCLSNGMRVLPGGNIRVVNGEHDQFAPDQSAAEAITGHVCAPGTKECVYPDKSGWYRVQDNEVTSGYADHTYFVKGFPPVFEPAYLPPYQTPWSIAYNLDYLQARLGH